jgi:hypothetical protein
MAIFGAWAIQLWGQASPPSGWDRGVIWAAPTGNNIELAWHGWQLIVGNAYVLTGLALLALLIGTAVSVARARQPGAVIRARSQMPQSQHTASRRPN